MATRKSWQEKMEHPTTPEVKTIPAAYAGIPPGSSMLIPTPRLIEQYLHKLPPGHLTEVKTLRNDLAMEHHTAFTCPLTTGIFLHTVAAAALEQLEQGAATTEVAPFWRAVAPGSPLTKKLGIDAAWLKKMLEEET